MSSPALFLPLPSNKLPNKPVPKGPSNILRNPPFCFGFCFYFWFIFNCFASIFYWFTSYKHVFMNSCICGWCCCCKLNGIKTLLANDISAFPIKGKPFFSNSPSKRPPKNPPDCPILCNWVFDNFILTEELFSKFLRSLGSCVLVNNNLWGKLFSSLE